MEQIIECNNLTHYYGKRLIYENLSFTVPKGRILVLAADPADGDSLACFCHCQRHHRCAPLPLKNM